MKINVLIVDDEVPDRELLKSLISTYCTELSVVGTAASVSQAEQFIHEFKPAVVLLDIEMPRENGFDLLAKYPHRTFLTVMTTGYDQHGIRAIKAGAFDYLLKPIDVDELLETEQKIINSLQSSPLQNSATLKVFHNGEQWLVKVVEIAFVEAQGSYTQIHINNGTTLLSSKNLVSTLGELDEKKFVRVHRSYAVNLDHVKSFQPVGNEGLITLQTGRVVKVGRKFKPSLKNLWS